MKTLPKILVFFLLQAVFMIATSQMVAFCGSKFFSSSSIRIDALETELQSPCALIGILDTHLNIVNNLDFKGADFSRFFLHDGIGFTGAKKMNTNNPGWIYLIQIRNSTQRLAERNLIL